MVMDSGFGACAPPRNDGRKRQGSVANLMRPVSWSVLTSKVRISVAPPISSVTTIAIAGNRGGDDARRFRQRDDRFGRRANTAGVKETVADDTDHGGDRNQRRETRYDHHQPHAGGEARRGSIALGRRRSVAVGTRLLPFALRFSGS